MEVEAFKEGMIEIYKILTFQLAPLLVKCLEKMKLKYNNYDVSTNLYTLLREKKRNPEIIDVSRRDIFTTIDARNDTMHQDYESHKKNRIKHLESIKKVLAFVNKHLDKNR